MTLSTFKLNDGHQIPAFGLGTWKSKDNEAYRAVKHAIEVGYRHIDCAWIYQNEAEVGRALGEAFDAGTVKRSDLFITSKLWNSFHAVDAVEKAVRQSLSSLQLDALDLYLMHWPIAFRPDVVFPRSDEGFWPLSEVPLARTFEAMLALKEKGLVKSVGVSNFSASKLQALTDAVGTVPAVNQVELHPHLPQPSLVEYCCQAGIHLTAYSPLGSADRPANMKKAGEPPLLENEVVRSAAQAEGLTPAQLLIGWAIHRGTSVIPKSVNPARIEQNIAAVSHAISDATMTALDNIESTYRYVDPQGMFRPGVTHDGDDFWA